MATLRSISTPARDGDRFRIDIPVGWRQGRGAFGGLTVGALIRAIEQAVADPARVVRSVTAELPGPTEPGPSEITVAAARASESPLAWCELQAPVTPPWRDVARSPVGVGAGGPSSRSTSSTASSRASRSPAAARCIGWIRPRDPDPAWDAGAIAALIDAWFPAAMVRMIHMRPCAIAFTLELVDGTDGLDPTAPMLYRGTVPVCGDGYFLEIRELWGEDGRLVAINHQTFVVIR